jgi:iron complex outermembrane receptor protein
MRRDKRRLGSGSGSFWKQACRAGALAVLLPCVMTVAQAQEEETIEEVIVTGSQIRGASTTGALPVSVLGEDEIAAAGVASADELFRYVPGVGAVGFGGNNQRSTSFGINGARGDVASINLRSLGEGNTLVLMNGRRLVDHPSTQTDEQTAPAVAVNMNAIPIMGLQRVEILRDGASALYGTDAVAGVVNTILRKDYEGVQVTGRFGGAEGYDETTISLLGGLNFNNDQTNITGSFTRHDRSEMSANDRDFSKNRDARGQVTHPDFLDDASFNNSSTVTPWGVFQVPGVGAVTQFGEPITTSSGRFALVPDSVGGADCVDIAAAPEDTCIIAASSVPTDLRHNRNAAATLMPGVVRTNFFLTANHTFDNDYELYFEGGLYKASSDYNRNDGGGGPLGTQPIDMAASNYWNPFGPVTFSDGTVNPNRLPGLDPAQIPIEGVSLPFRSGEGGARGFYRFSERPGPLVNVKDESYRALSGLRGSRGDWDFDTGILYSKAETTDRTTDRLDLNAVMRQLALETPEAYNLWTGGGTYDQNSFDSTFNPESTTEPYYIQVDRQGTTRLMLADFKVSTNTLFELPAGGLGFGAGVEFRRHTYEDNRDPRLDGTAPLNNFVRDQIFPSSVMGSSDTPDTFGKRNVFSVFAELAVPLVSSDMNIPLIDSLDVQLAARYEDFDDIGSVTKPRIALSWYLIEGLQFRASYSEGFKAPNLAAVSEPVISRQVAGEDLWYCQAQVNKGDAPNLGACTGEGVGNEFLTGVERLTSGSALLKPEESESFSYGIVYQPSFVEGLTLTVDYWSIDQTGIIGIFGTPNHISLDWALRINGLAPNPEVVRLDPTPDNVAFFAGSGLDPVGQIIQTNVPYFNLDSRETTGIDFSIMYDLDTDRLGNFTFGVNGAKLTKAFQTVGTAAQFINDQNNPLVQVVSGGDLIRRNQRPEWKSSSFVKWNSGKFGAGFFINYVSDFLDTSVISDTTGEFWTVDSWTTMNIHGEYNFSAGMFSNATFRIGVNNLADEDPPLADENLNYMASMHTPYGQYIYGTLILGFDN